VFLLVFAQLVARLIVQVLEHADEQVGRIVERLGKLRADVNDRQRIALGASVPPFLSHPASGRCSGTA
jgi:hypothetical protein